MSINEKTRGSVLIQPQSIVEFACLQELRDLNPEGPDTELKADFEFIIIWIEI